MIALITPAAAAAIITTVIMRQGRALVQKSPVFLQQVAAIARLMLFMLLRRCARHPAASPVSPICYNFLMHFRPFQLVSLLQHSEDVMTVPPPPSPFIYDAHLLAHRMLSTALCRYIPTLFILKNIQTAVTGTATPAFLTSFPSGALRLRRASQSVGRCVGEACDRLR
jgi:magnesium-transporting ATPase (P-type)